MFCPYWLRNVLRATTAWICSSLIWPDGSASAALASLLFDPPEPQIIGKPFRAPSSSFFWLSLLWSSFFFSSLLVSSLLFSSRLVSSLLFSSLTLPIFAFRLSIFSEVWLLNFLRSIQFNRGLWGFVHIRNGKSMQNGLTTDNSRGRHGKWPDDNYIVNDPLLAACWLPVDGLLICCYSLWWSSRQGRHLRSQESLTVALAEMQRGSQDKTSAAKLYSSKCKTLDRRENTRSKSIQDQNQNCGRLRGVHLIP